MFMTRRNVFEKTLLATVAAAGLLASASTFADAIKTQIVDVRLTPQNKRPLYEAFADDGRVYTTIDKHIARRLKDAVKTHEVLSLVTSDDEIIGFNELSKSEKESYTSPLAGSNAREFLPDAAPALASDLNTILPGTHLKSEKDDGDAAPAPRSLTEARSMGFEPTVLASMADAQRLYDSERALEHSSQCHERAMVWAYDMYTSRGVKSMKTVMFFTEQFRSRYGTRSNGFFGPSFKPYKWWYHTAPFVYVGNQEIVLDQEFRPGPEQIDTWTYWFTTEAARYAGVTPPSLESAKCQEITKYSPLANGQPMGYSGQDCLLRKLPMYYMMPASFAANDCDPSRENAPGRSGYLNDGRPKYPCYREVLTGFQKWTIERAYDNAHGR
jgi:hypothetical protein